MDRTARPPRPRTRRPARPRCEPLEGRALMAYSALDPTFGAGGVALGTRATPLAVAARPDGKVLTVESTYPTLEVARYNTDGTLDATFGTNGRATIPFPAAAPDFEAFPGNLALLPDGSVAVAFTAVAPGSGVPELNDRSVVARLTPAGQLDANFGTGGEVLLPASVMSRATVVAAQPDGDLVVAGSGPTAGASNGRGDAVVARLTPAGQLDANFNGTGSVEFAVPHAAVPGSPFLTVTGVAVDAAGRIVLGGTSSVATADGVPISIGVVARVTAAGRLDATFGSAGAASVGGSVDGLALQADGKVVVAGISPITNPGFPTVTLARLDADGTADASFARTATFLASLMWFYTDPPSVAVGPDGEITVAGTAGFDYPTYRSALVVRFRADGTPDAGFGTGGVVRLPVKSPGSTRLSGIVPSAAHGVAVTAANQIVVAGAVTVGIVVEQGLVARLLPVAVTHPADDYDLDGKSDVAALITGPAVFAVRPSGGRPDVLQAFGVPGAGNSIPAPGDYDGDGVADVAAYLPRYGILAYRPSSKLGGSEEAPDVLVPFGPAGAGASIPAPGDYDGDGVTDVAVYLPAYGELAVRPSNGGANYLVPFGPAGAGDAIPVPGDYDGDGKTDVAVYMPAYGALAVHPSGGGPNYLVPFGSAGPGGSIPVPGDYDGDGKTDVAVYLPAFGELAVHPSSGVANYLVPFGGPGSGLTVPAPGDYDGDGKTDVAAYLPKAGVFAYRPSSGGPDVLESFGAPGSGATVPAATLPGAGPSGVSAASLLAAPSPVVYIPLVDLPPSPFGTKPKKA